MTKVQVFREDSQNNKVVHKVGNYYLIDGGLCILAGVDVHAVQLISLDDGNRWRDPVVVDSVFDIRHEEFNKICVGIDWEFVPSVKISY